MTELFGDLWTYHRQHADEAVVVTTNGAVGRNGAVMGRGTAKQAKDRFPQLPYKLKLRIAESGNRVYYFHEYQLVTFPVKYLWWERADMELIETSCRELVEAVDKFGLKKIYMPRPGCSNGLLSWTDVKPLLEAYLDDRFCIVELTNEPAKR